MAADIKVLDKQFHDNSVNSNSVKREINDFEDTDRNNSATQARGTMDKKVFNTSSLNVQDRDDRRPDMIRYETAINRDACDDVCVTDLKDDVVDDITRNVARQFQQQHDVLHTRTNTTDASGYRGPHLSIDCSTETICSDKIKCLSGSLVQEEQRTNRDASVSGTDGEEISINNHSNNIDDATNKETDSRVDFFPDLSEQDILRKLQDADVTKQFKVTDSLREITISNLSLLEQVNRTDPAIRRILMRPRLALKEVQNVSIDADIKALVNEFLQTNMSGSFVMGRMMRENYCTFYNWLTAHLQVERNAWICRLKQVLVKLDKQRRDGLNLKDLMVKSTKRVQHLAQSCNSAMFGASRQDMKDMTLSTSRIPQTCTRCRSSDISHGGREQIETLSFSNNECTDQASREHVNKICCTFSNNGQTETAHKQRLDKINASFSSNGRFKNSHTQSVNNIIGIISNNGQNDVLSRKNLNTTTQSLDVLIEMSQESDQSSTRSSNQMEKRTTSINNGKSNRDPVACPLPGDCFSRAFEKHSSRNPVHSKSISVTREGSVETMNESLIVNPESGKLNRASESLTGTDKGEEISNGGCKEANCGQDMRERIDDLADICSTLISDRLACLRLLGADSTHDSSLVEAVSKYLLDRHTSSHCTKTDVETRLATIENENRNLLKEIYNLHSSLTEKDKETLILLDQILRLEELLKESSKLTAHKSVWTDYTVRNSNKTRNSKCLNGMHQSCVGFYLGTSKITKNSCAGDKRSENGIGIQVIMPKRSKRVPDDISSYRNTKQATQNGSESSCMPSEEQSGSSIGQIVNGTIGMQPITLKLRASDNSSVQAVTNGIEMHAKRQTRDKCTFDIRVIKVQKTSPFHSNNSGLNNTNCSNQAQRKHSPRSAGISGNLTNAVTNHCCTGKSRTNLLEQTQHLGTSLPNEGCFLHQSNRLDDRSVEGITRTPDDDYNPTDCPVSIAVKMRAANGSHRHEINNKNSNSRKDSIKSQENVGRVSDDYKDKKKNKKDRDKENKASNKCILHSNMVSLVSSPVKEEPHTFMSRARQHRKTVVSKCLRCQKLFNWVDNHKLACSYHKEGMARVEQYDLSGKIIKVANQWTCCLRSEEAEGCCFGQHV